MTFKNRTVDAQANLEFVQAQAAHVEAEVYRVQYRELNYAEFITIDNSANPYASSVDYYSQDMAGRAEFLGSGADDVPYASISQNKTTTQVYAAGIGYEYSFFEIGRAIQLGINLDTDSALAAVRAYDEMIYRIAFLGDATKGFQGILDYSTVPTVTAPNGAGGSPLWENKTPDEIIADVNTVLGGVFLNTEGVEMADTLILPEALYNYVSSTRLTDASITIMEFLRRANVYTMRTGQELRIMGHFDLTAIGAGGTRRLVAYNRSPQVVKMHVPMPHQFLTAQEKGLMIKVPGVFSVGGADIRRPLAFRYMDGV